MTAMLKDQNLEPQMQIDGGFFSFSLSWKAWLWKQVADPSSAHVKEMIS